MPADLRMPQIINRRSPAPQFWSGLVAHARGVPRSQSCERDFLPPFSSPRVAAGHVWFIGLETQFVNDLIAADAIRIDSPGSRVHDGVLESGEHRI
jgi:hypothetical protein